MYGDGAAHGNAATYRSTIYACRCDECKAATKIRARREQADRVARLAADPTLAPHGSAHTYKNWGCRCEACSAAHSAYLKARDHHYRRPATAYM